MTDDIRIPIIEEDAQIVKRRADTERVSVRTVTHEDEVFVRDALRQEHVEVTRVPIDREIAEAPVTRTEGDLMIVPVLEERLVVEKRLILVEELHLRRITSTQDVELPTTLRRMSVEVERHDLHNQEDH